MTRPARRPPSVLAAAVLALATAALVPAAATAEPPEPAGAGYGLTQVLSGYSDPIYVLGDGSGKRLFIVERTGRIKGAWRPSIDSPWQKRGVFLDVRDRLTSEFHEQGLLGMAFHPQYASNRRFYITFTRKSDEATVIREYRRSSGSAFRADRTSGRFVLATPASSPANHNGGWIDFGPDGYLYLANGDGGGPSGDRSRAPDQRFGKILRLDPLDPDGDGPARFSVPADNPYAGATAGDDLVWASGLRNPWRNSFDMTTGDLYVGDVGQTEWEEVTRLPGPDAGKGADLGWHDCEGRHAYPDPGDADAPCLEKGTVIPQLEYEQVATRCAVTGGYVYRGLDQPSLSGTYFVADYCSGDLWAVPASDFDDGSVTLGTPLDTSLLISSFGEDRRGELYVTDLRGGIYRIEED